MTAFLAPALTLGLIAACDKGSGGGSGAAGDMMSRIPTGSAIVGGISFDKMRKSELFAKYKDKMTSEMPPELKDMKEVCGIDVVNDMGSAVLGTGQNVNDENQMVVAMHGNFDESKASKCFVEMDKKHGEGTGEPAVAKEGKLTRYTSREGKSAYVYWADGKTLVMSPGASENADSMNKLIGGKSVKEDKELMALVGKIDTGSALWAAGKFPPNMSAPLAMVSPEPPQHFYAAFDVDSGVKAKIGLRFATEDQAKGMVEKVQALLPMAKAQAGEMAGLVDAVKFEHSGVDAIVTLELTAAQIDMIVQKLPQ